MSGDFFGVQRKPQVGCGESPAVLKTFETWSSIRNVNMYSLSTDSEVYGLLDLELMAGTYSERRLDYLWSSAKCSREWR
jgi:hypothetical protein